MSLTYHWILAIIHPYSLAHSCLKKITHVNKHGFKKCKVHNCVFFPRTMGDQQGASDSKNPVILIFQRNPSHLLDHRQCLPWTILYGQLDWVHEWIKSQHKWKSLVIPYIIAWVNFALCTILQHFSGRFGKYIKKWVE